LGQPELATDPRFKDLAARAKNAAELIGIVQGWLDSTASDEEALNLLLEHRVPHAPVLTVPQAMAHPHLRARGTVRTVHDRFLGDFDVPGFPMRFSKFPGQMPLDAPTLGEHNEVVLRDYLGYSPERIRALEADGVLHHGPR
jgi:CoA:oxalate CoA-transferase